jgi:hypothetical protein
MPQETPLAGAHTGCMNMQKTAGQKLVELLTTGLPNGIVWSAQERAILEQIEATADEIEVLKRVLAAEVKAIDRNPHRVAELSGEIRMARAAIVRMTSTLDPEMQVQAKSARHVAAAHSRWSGAGLGGR